MGDGDYLCESTSAGNNVLLYLKQNKGSWHEKDNAMDGALDIWPTNWRFDVSKIRLFEDSSVNIF